MGKVLTLLLALLAPSLAQAATFKDQRGQWWNLPTPPAQIFDRPYAGKISTNLMSEAEIVEVCSTATGKAEPFGCSFPGPAYCYIYVSSDLPQKFRKAVEHHELAHCHGWPASHPETLEDLTDNELLKLLNGR